MGNKIRCVVLDDDPLALEFVKDSFKDLEIAELVASFSCPYKFLNVIPTIDFELALLDITMPKIDGFSIAKVINEKHIIYITGIERNLKKATQLSPIDIISKPYNKERLRLGLEKAQKIIYGKVNEFPSFNLFHVEGINGLVNLKTDDIIFARADEKERRHKNIILQDGKKYKLLYCTFERLLKHSDNLIRINKSEVIAKSAVSIVEADIITLNLVGEGGKPKQVTLNRTYRHNLK